MALFDIFNVLMFNHINEYGVFEVSHMAQRTYLIGLYLVLNASYRYISRWLPKLEASMTSEQFTCLIAVLDALQACLPLILPAPPIP